MDDQGESVEVRVQGAVEVVEERLKQLQKMTESPVTTPAEESSVNSLQLPIAMTRQVCLLHMCLNTDEKALLEKLFLMGQLSQNSLVLSAPLVWKLILCESSNIKPSARVRSEGYSTFLFVAVCPTIRHYRLQRATPIASLHSIAAMCIEH